MKYLSTKYIIYNNYVLFAINMTSRSMNKIRNIFNYNKIQIKLK